MAGTDTSYVPLRTPTITSEARTLTEKEGQSGAALVFLVRAGSALSSLPFGRDIARILTAQRRLARGDGAPSMDSPLVVDLPPPGRARVVIATLAPEAPAYERLTLARTLIAAHPDVDSLTLAVFGFTPKGAQAAAEALVCAALAARADLPNYRKEPSPPRRLVRLRVAGADLRPRIARLLAEARANHLVRFLTALPPNRLTPGHYRAFALKIARAQGWTARFWSLAALKRAGAGAFLAVAQGSAVPDAGILQLRYRPRAARGAPLALIGKGVCFDTGGTNLKTARHMHGMHEDMAGSAVALGTLCALTELKVPFAVDAWLALSDNAIGPRAYRQNEVVRAANGMTIEVTHTDAEGRMLLADTLAIAARTRPRVMMDFATLTGACVYALGTRYSGVFTNRPALWPALIACGQACGERIWPFPLDRDYLAELKSPIADLKQCLLDGEADHILAGAFLEQFVADTPWIHVDLSSARHKGGLAHVPGDLTGFGVRLALSLTLDGTLEAI